MALWARWLWLQKTDASKPWSGLDLAVSDDSRALFNAPVSISIGTGASVKFWVDAWIDGLTVDAIAPALTRLVRPSVRKARSVADGIPDHAWHETSLANSPLRL
jgi:hypothetical protein